MATHIIRRKLFERAWQPQQAPLYTIPLDLYRDKFQASFWPAIAQQLNSIRAFATKPRDKFWRTDFPQTAPLGFVPLLLDPSIVAPALLQLSGSFASRSRGRMHQGLNLAPAFIGTTAVAAVTRKKQLFLLLKVGL